MLTLYSKYLRKIQVALKWHSNSFVYVYQTSKGLAAGIRNFKRALRVFFIWWIWFDDNPCGSRLTYFGGLDVHIKDYGDKEDCWPPYMPLMHNELKLFKSRASGGNNYLWHRKMTLECNIFSLSWGGHIIASFQRAKCT